MPKAGLFIPFDDIKRDPQLQRAISAYLSTQVGSPATPKLSDREEEGLAELSGTQARLFLNNCSDKTIKVIRFIVAHEGAFDASELYRHMRTDDLRGVWTGLTRRLRSITKNPDATLLNWFTKPDGWRAVMAARTVSSFRSALAEHG